MIKIEGFEKVQPIIGWEWNGQGIVLTHGRGVAVNMEFRAVCPECPAVHGARGIQKGQGSSLRAARVAAKKAAKKWVQDSCSYFV